MSGLRERLRALQARGKLVYYVSIATVLSLVFFPAIELVLQAVGVVPSVTFYDFIGAFQTAGQRVLGPEPLYARVENPYVYPPIVSLAFVPFAPLPPMVAGAVWVVLTFGFLYWCIVQLLDSLSVSLSRGEHAVLVAALLGFFPTILWIKSGQVSGAIAGLFCIAAALAERHRGGDVTRRRLAGATTAVTALVKPMYAPACAHLLRDRRRLSGGILGVVALYVGSFLVFGVETLRDYVGVLLLGKGWGQEADPGGVSGALTDWGPSIFRPFAVFGDAAVLVHFAVAGVVALATLASVTRRDAQLDRHVLCLGFLTVPFASPIPDLYAVYATVPALVIVLVDEFRRERGYPLVPVLGVLSLHVHAYVLGFFAGFGTRFVPSVSALEPLLPLLQTGVWGLAAVFVLQGSRAVGRWRAVG